MPNLNPYVKTVKTYTAEDIAGWEVKVTEKVSGTFY